MEYKRKLVDYIQRNLAKGYTIDSLQIALTNQGYSKAIVEKAIEQANRELAEKAPVLKEKPTIKYEVIDEFDKPITIRRSFWKKLLGL